MVLGIYGYGGLGREVYVIAKKINKHETRWSEICFIDDADVKSFHGEKIYTFHEAINKFSNLEIAIGVGNPATRAILFKKVVDAGISVATIIHPGVYIDETTQIGEGTIICEGVTITCDVKIGKGSYVQPHAVIGHDITIGDFSMIGANAEIGGADVIGDRFYLGFNAGTKESLTIGNDVICSAGAVVFRDLPDEVIAVGNPARIMKKNEDKKVFK